MKIAWDETKNRANQAKHGVSFEEASVLFSSGVGYLEIFDDTHSAEEDRFIAIGPIRRGLVLIVWTEPEEEIVRIVRIVSARWATKREQAHFLSTLEQLE